MVLSQKVRLVKCPLKSDVLLNTQQTPTTHFIKDQITYKNTHTHARAHTHNHFAANTEVKPM